MKMLRLIIALTLLAGFSNGNAIGVNSTQDEEDANFDEEEVINYLKELCQLVDTFKEELEDAKTSPELRQTIGQTVKRFKKESENWLPELEKHIITFRNEVTEADQLNDIKRVKRSYSKIKNIIKARRFKPNLLIKPNMECEMKVASLVNESKGCMCGAHKTMVTVPRTFNNDIYPKCVILEQCMGPCSHPNMKCVAVETEEHNMPVVTGARCDSVLMEKHLNCECKCGMTETDCNSEQEFDAAGCQCKCKETPECSDNMRWNPIDCKCQCMDIEECSTGLKFDMNKCMCV